MSSSLPKNDNAAAGTGQEAPRADEDEVKKSMFSEPWKGSDLVLLVENQGFHVHRLILSMASPVFEKMTGNEIELSEKKAEEICDLLKQIYPQGRGDISMDNVGYLLTLAAEYEISDLEERCKKYLFVQPNTSKDVVIKVLLVAQRNNLSEVRKHCYRLLSKMCLYEIEELEGFEDLDGDSTREVLGDRLRALEDFLEELYPQLSNLVDCAQRFWNESQQMKQAKCPLHAWGGDKDLRKLLSCSFCKAMLERMETQFQKSVYAPGMDIARLLKKMISLSREKPQKKQVDFPDI